MNDDLRNAELAARRLIDRYVHACDRPDVDLMVSLFGDDGELRVRGQAYRGDRIREFYGDRLALPTLHFTTGLVLGDASGDEVATTCGFVAIEMPDDGWTFVAGRYDDVVRVDDQGVARFVVREITISGKRRLV